MLHYFFPGLFKMNSSLPLLVALVMISMVHSQRPADVEPTEIAVGKCSCVLQTCSANADCCVAANDRDCECHNQRCRDRNPDDVNPTVVDG